MNAGAESVGSALMAAPSAVIGATAGVCLAAALLFVLENIVWFMLGTALACSVAFIVLVAKARKNLRDGTATWHPSMARTAARLNGAPRPAVALPAPAVLALEPPKPPMLPAGQAKSLTELGAAIAAVRDAGQPGGQP
jgi:Flp pilus assembly protein protease CpaA